MDWSNFLQYFLLAPFLLICFLLITSAFFYSSSTAEIPSKQELINQNIEQLTQELNGQNYPLLCLLEDAPESSLKGQYFELMTPFACLFEDIPERFLNGQSYELAYPLMTPFACVVTSTWHNFYRQYLGQVNINYWHWKNQPEVNTLCEELTNLLKLPKPSPLAQKVITSFGKNQSLFQGYRQNFWQQVESYGAFLEWHQTGIKILGKETFINVYQVCYNTSWDKVENVVNHLQQLLLRKSIPWWIILNVHGKAYGEEVEIAYKKLLKKWHPDLNHHSYSHQITARINVAYEQYQEYQEENIKSQHNRREKLNLIWKKFEKTIKIVWKEHLIPLVYRE